MRGGSIGEAEDGRFPPSGRRIILGGLMGTFRMDGEVVNVSDPGTVATVPQLLVDTGSEFTWVPEPILIQVGVRIVKKDLPFLMANGQTNTRATGYAILRESGLETIDEVVFGQPGDLSQLGSRTLEGFGVTVDPSTKRLVAAGPHPAASGDAGSGMSLMPSSTG